MNFPSDKVVKGECVNCRRKDRWLLHRILLRGADRRVCTSCVLRLHPSSFCPYCFEFFDHPLSATSSAAAHRFISCVKCSSLTHLRCLPSPPPPPTPFLCPPCSKPNFTFFPVPESPIDKNLARVLLCASKIAAASMAKTLFIATSRADRAVKESTAARKRVKEALDHYCEVQKLRQLEEVSIEVSGSRDFELDHKVECKHESFDGFNGEQAKVKVLPSEVLSLQQQQQHKNGASGNAVIVKDEIVDIVGDDDGRLGKCEQDLERVRGCHGRIFDHVTSTT